MAQHNSPNSSGSVKPSFLPSSLPSLFSSFPPFLTSCLHSLKNSVHSHFLIVERIQHETLMHKPCVSQSTTMMLVAATLSLK